MDTQEWWDKLGFKDQRALLEQSHNEPLSGWLTEAVAAAGRTFDTDRGRLTPEEWTFIGKQRHAGHDHDGDRREQDDRDEHGGSGRGGGGF